MNIIVEKIKLMLNEKTDNNKLLLITTLNETSGFLLSGKKLFFASKNNGKKSELINTNHLSLQTNIFINTIENSPSFKPNYYDLLIYDLNIDGSYLESFVELCEIYANRSSELDFNYFFYSLLKLFEPSKESSFSNLVGMFGELVFIRKMYDEYKINISDSWHNAEGTTDKYDFSFKNVNTEIKTTIKSDQIFMLKHSQIFNCKKNYIVVINANVDNSGLTMKELYDYFKKTEPFSNNLDFQIKLESEKKKVSPADFSLKKLSVSEINIFLNSKLETLVSIPECISNISYSYDFVGKENVDINDFILAIGE